MKTIVYEPSNILYSMLLKVLQSQHIQRYQTLRKKNRAMSQWRIKTVAVWGNCPPKVCSAPLNGELQTFWGAATDNSTLLNCYKCAPFWCLSN